MFLFALTDGGGAGVCDVEHVLVGPAAVECGVEERLGDAVPLRPELAAQPVGELVVHRRHRRQHLLVVRQVRYLRMIGRDILNGYW